MIPVIYLLVGTRLVLGCFRCLRRAPLRTLLLSLPVKSGINSGLIVYCLLVNRMQFLREQSYQGHLQTVSITCATLCELGTHLFRFVSIQVLIL
jgi:hypothetical protein